MRRKIARIGPSTLMISLPSRWARSQGLNKGDELEVVEGPGKLTIKAEAGAELLKSEIDISHLDIMVVRYLNAIYKRGYDEIKVFYDDPKLLNSIQKVIGKEAVGYEIIEQGKAYCVIKNVSGELTDFDAILRRTFLLLMSMAEEGADVLEKGELERLRNITFLEETNNRFTTSLRRYLNKKGHEHKTMFYYLVEELERIADEYKYLYQYALEHGLEADLGHLREVNKLLRQFYEVFYDYDDRKLVHISKKRKAIIKELVHSLPRAKGDAIVLDHHCLVLAQRIFSLVDPYIAMRV